VDAGNMLACANISLFGKMLITRPLIFLIPFLFSAVVIQASQIFISHQHIQMVNSLAAYCITFSLQRSNHTVSEKTMVYGWKEAQHCLLLFLLNKKLLLLLSVADSRV
jgi:hypothetical protein